MTDLIFYRLNITSSSRPIVILNDPHLPFLIETCILKIVYSSKKKMVIFTQNFI